MNAEEKTKQKMQRITTVKSWPTRMSKLKKRKENPMRECDVAEAAGLSASQLNRIINFKHLPYQDSVDRVEAVLVEQGV